MAWYLLVNVLSSENLVGVGLGDLEDGWVVVHHQPLEGAFTEWCSSLTYEMGHGLLLNNVSVGGTHELTKVHAFVALAQ